MLSERLVTHRTDRHKVCSAVCLYVFVYGVTSTFLFKRPERLATAEVAIQALLLIAAGFGLLATEGSWSLAVKRGLDLVVVCVSLPSFAPVLLMAALLIRLESKGPILVSQMRLGRSGRPFLLYKFRTKRSGSSGNAGLTCVGNWLRRSSLQEWPQLINVLKGDMSLVGPRPLPPLEAAIADPEWLRIRSQVRPGVTGLWQISGTDCTILDRWMKLDILYASEWSVRLDMRIMLQTIPAAFRGAAVLTDKKLRRIATDHHVPWMWIASALDREAEA